MNYEQFKHKDKNIFLVDMTKESSKVFSELAEKWLNKYIKEWKKIWIIVNKKWYSSWVICWDCGYIPKCKKCDIPIAYHLDENWNEFWICHICKTTYNKEANCWNCWWYDVKNYWTWTQKLQEIILERFKKKSTIIESETVNSPNKIAKIYEEIKSYQIIIWTSLLTMPIKDIAFDLIIFVNADIWLNIPDFNSNYNNFLFLYDAFSKHTTNNFIVQSFNTESYSIRAACKLNFEEFKKNELNFRENYSYPPYTDMCVILYKNEIEDKLFTKVNKLYQELLFIKESWGFKDIEIFSTPPLIYKMFGKYRYNIILKWKNLRGFMDQCFEKLKIFEKWFKIDREPQNII